MRYQPEDHLPADAPRRLRFDGSRIPPPGYTYHERPNRGFLISGSLVFSAFYLIGLSAVHRSGSPTSGWMFVPFVGPFLERATTDHCDEVEPVYDSATGSYRTNTTPCRTLGDEPLTFFGASQAIGAGLFALSYVVPARYYLRYDLSSVELSPWASQTGAGLGARGAF